MFTRSRVVVVGAGNICNGFLFHAEKDKLLEDFDFLVLDKDPEALNIKKRHFPFITIHPFDADKADLSLILKKDDWVLSLLPARYHKTLAEKCLLKECHL